MKRLLLIFLMLTISQIIKSQNLEKHLWKERVLLIFTKDKNDEKFKNQLHQLSREKEGLAERKLIIYRLYKDRYATQFNANWFPSSIKAENYKDKSNDFTIVLIGLDGGIKLKQQELLSTKKLFTIIDGMPMRRNEIKSKN